ncbi:MAG: GTP 3',8-cyclase MoaA [Rhodopirellula sp. TMED11]|nr:MAG: GTP 3',8-cyclase MoaA [Rhodopirellula sp. TMED11]
MSALTQQERPAFPLIDRFGRLHRSLRVSVTDRCNLRCFYCMPEHGAEFAKRETLLSFEEIHRLVDLLVTRCGIRDVRLTGGEPLARKDFPVLVEMLAGVNGLKDLSLTTNGILLDEFAGPLRQAGLQRLNISLDTVDEQTFQQISRRKGIDKVIAGIDAAIETGFQQIKLNTTAIKGVTESQVISLVRFAMERGVQIRFIEFMPLDTDQQWRRQSVLSGQEIRAIIEAEFGAMQTVNEVPDSQPAREFRLGSGHEIGLIQSVTTPFCEACDRIRLTADGSIRNCLFSQQEFPLRDAMRGGASDDEVLQMIAQAIEAKAAGHGINEAEFKPPERPMYSIGG